MIDHIVISGGTKDAKWQNFTSQETYAEHIDQCLEKLKEAAQNDPEKKVLIKQVQLVVEGQRHDEDEVVRQLYLDPVDIECFEFKENLKTVARTGPWGQNQQRRVAHPRNQQRWPTFILLIHGTQPMALIHYRSSFTTAEHSLAPTGSYVFGADDALDHLASSDT